MSALEVMALLEAALLLANILAHRKYVQETEEKLLMCKAEYFNIGFTSGVEWMKNKRKNGVELPNGANKGEILVKTARILFPDIEPHQIEHRCCPDPNYCQMVFTVENKKLLDPYIT